MQMQKIPNNTNRKHNHKHQSNILSTIQDQNHARQLNKILKP